MAQSAEEIYISSNGDRWTLIRDANSGRLSVRHEANPSSGGRVTDTDVDVFLSIAGSGPEFTALRRLLNRPSELSSPVTIEPLTHAGRGPSEPLRTSPDHAVTLRSSAALLAPARTRYTDAAPIPVRRTISVRCKPSVSSLITSAALARAVGFRPLYFPSCFALATPSRCRSNSIPLALMAALPDYAAIPVRSSTSCQR